jgi:hypothetical protein
VNIRQPNRVTHTYTQQLCRPPAEVFALLCPVREADWIDGWQPLAVLSKSGCAEPDCVFITDAEPHDAIWYITRHEPERGLIEMLKITPAVTACKLTIQLRDAPCGCEADVTYSHTSLGPQGDVFVASFTAEFYVQFMREWEDRINHYLAHGACLRSSPAE